MTIQEVADKLRQNPASKGILKAPWKRTLLARYRERRGRKPLPDNRARPKASQP